jgi:hypothetical protein
MGSIHLAEKNNMPYQLIIKAMSYGFFFRAGDEEGNFFPADSTFHEAISENFESALINLLMFDPESDSIIIKDLKSLFLAVKNENNA